MLKIFCQQCGGPNEYTSKKPNFCTSCGSSFPWNKSIASKPKVVEPEVEEDEEEEADEIQSFDLSNMFEFDINVGNSKSVTIADIYKNPSSIQGAERIAPKNAKKNLETLRERVRQVKPIDLD